MEYKQIFEFTFRLSNKPIAQQRPRLYTTHAGHQRGFNPNGKDCAEYRFRLYTLALKLNRLLSDWSTELGLPEFRTYFPVFRVSHVQAMFVSTPRKNRDIRQICENSDEMIPNLDAADIDNLLKFALDAGNKSLWHDDHQIWSLSTKKLLSSEPSVTFTITMTMDDFIESEHARIDHERKCINTVRRKSS